MINELLGVRCEQIGHQVVVHVAGEVDLATAPLLAQALSEAAANVILHSYQGEAGRSIELIVDTDADRISLSLYHQGRDFEP